MARLIDAEKIEFEPILDPLHGYPIMNKIMFLGRSNGKTLAMVQEALKQSIENQPTVDAVEVVRCKDCKHSACNPVKLTYACRHPSGLRGFVNEGYYFCSYGERRDNERTD